MLPAAALFILTDAHHRDIRAPRAAPVRETRATRPVAAEPAVTIRRARPGDAAALTDLAALDSARPLVGDILVAEMSHEPVAALHLLSGRSIADPTKPSAGAVALLRVRAGQIHAATKASRHGRRHRLSLTAAIGRPQ